jgi:hypothetical protein
MINEKKFQQDDAKNGKGTTLLRYDYYAFWDTRCLERQSFMCKDSGPSKVHVLSTCAFYSSVRHLAFYLRRTWIRVHKKKWCLCKETNNKVPDGTSPLLIVVGSSIFQ